MLYSISYQNRIRFVFRNKFSITICVYRFIYWHKIFFNFRLIRIARATSGKAIAIGFCTHAYPFILCSFFNHTPTRIATIICAIWSFFHNRSLKLRPRNIRPRYTLEILFINFMQPVVVPDF